MPGDYETQVSQGEITLHSEEHLNSTDRGISMLRKVYRDQLNAIAEGKDPMGVSFDAPKELVASGCRHRHRAGGFLSHGCKACAPTLY